MRDVGPGRIRVAPGETWIWLSPARGLPTCSYRMQARCSGTGYDQPMSTRRVLMIAYVFPPSGGSGVQRAAKFAKYLPGFGWTPLVWSAPSVPELPQDETLGADLPADLDHRTRPGVHPGHTLRAALRRLRQAAGPHRRTVSLLDGLEWRLGKVAQGVSKWSMPDTAMPWALASLPALRRIVRRERIDAVYSTFSPASNHLLAWLLTRRGGLPWSADFRDLWTDNFDFDDPRTVRRRMRQWFENTFLRSADAVVGVSADQTRILGGHVPGEEDKFVTITNGADTDDFASLDRRTVRRELGIDPRRFVLTYVGSFASWREPLATLEGVSAFLRRGHDMGDRFEFRIVGTIPKLVMRYVERTGVAPTTRGYVSHGQAVREMVAADCLLLSSPASGLNCASVLPGKIFEYLAAGRPILYVGPTPGASDALLTKCRAGVTLPPDPQRIGDMLYRFWSQWSRGTLPEGCPPDRFAPYSRRALTGKLAGLLDQLTG